MFPFSCYIKRVAYKMLAPPQSKLILSSLCVCPPPYYCRQNSTRCCWEQWLAHTGINARPLMGSHSFTSRRDK